MNKKAQSAMEFLMTYGWAILVVMIVIGAFVYLGVLKPREMVPRQCRFSGFYCEDHKLTESGLMIMLTNSYGVDLRLNYINFSSESGNIHCEVAGDANQFISVGDTKQISTTACSLFEATPGSRVKGTAILTFTEPVNSIEHKVVGTIITDVEN